MEYKFYITGSHGYLVVKHKELEDLGIATKISPFGYKMGDKVKAGATKRGYAKGGKVDQSMCSPRKQMAMGNG